MFFEDDNSIYCLSSYTGIVNIMLYYSVKQNSSNTVGAAVLVQGYSICVVFLIKCTNYSQNADFSQQCCFRFVQVRWDCW